MTDRTLYGRSYEGGKRKNRKNRIDDGHPTNTQIKADREVKRKFGIPVNRKEWAAWLALRAGRWYCVECGQAQPEAYPSEQGSCPACAVEEIIARA